jgi:hypothetical protein
MEFSSNDTGYQSKGVNSSASRPNLRPNYGADTMQNSSPRDAAEKPLLTGFGLENRI